jgi:heat shock protein HslJ
MTPLEGSQWWLTSYRTTTGEMVTAQVYGVEGPSIQLSEGGVGGNATCNRFFGAYEKDGDTLTIQPGGSTMMACPPEVMAQEQAFLTALGQVVRYEITNSTLQLFNASGEVVLTFTPDTPPALTGTLWQLTAYNNGREAVTSIIAGTQITATFDASGGLTGSAGCNNYMASYTLSDGTLSIGPGVSTRKFCAQPEGLMAQETAYLQALETAATYTLTGNTLTLKTASGATVAQFRAAN